MTGALISEWTICIWFDSLTCDWLWISDIWHLVWQSYLWLTLDLWYLASGLTVLLVTDSGSLISGIWFDSLTCDWLWICLVYLVWQSSLWLTLYIRYMFWHSYMGLTLDRVHLTYCWLWNRYLVYLVRLWISGDWFVSLTYDWLWISSLSRLSGLTDFRPTRSMWVLEEFITGLIFSQKVERLFDFVNKIQFYYWLYAVFTTY